MLPEELIECGTLLVLEQQGKLPGDKVSRLIELKIKAKRDLPTGNTEIVKEQIAKVLAEQIGADILKFLKEFGMEIAKDTMPLLLATIVSSIKKA